MEIILFETHEITAYRQSHLLQARLKKHVFFTNLRFIFALILSFLLNSWLLNDTWFDYISLLWIIIQKCIKFYRHNLKAKSLNKFTTTLKYPTYDDDETNLWAIRITPTIQQWHCYWKCPSKKIQPNQQLHRHARLHH